MPSAPDAQTPAQALAAVLAGQSPDPASAAAWLSPADLAEVALLMAAAGQLRRRYDGDEIELCAIVNAKSGQCSEDCVFCAQSAHYAGPAQTYPLLSAPELAQRASRAGRDGARRFGLVTSGRGCPRGAELDELCRAIELIREEGRVEPCASLGLLAPPEARRLADAGLTRYHHNLEAGPGFFPRVCTTHTLEERVATVHTAREAGLEICAGGIVGLGESPAERVELAQALAELDPESVPLNFLNPIPGTPLAGVPLLTPLEALATLAVFKLFLPRARLRTCGGRRQVLGRLAPLMYLAGAGATMTGDYLTTGGAPPAEDLADLAALGLRTAAAPQGA
ncbi:MAG: biotin synthase BioB [Deltaproteobacteria bacterium]|nr:biotin synthase BioB [Deltaproteobacteria bacterium]